MKAQPRWRMARFLSTEQRAEFIQHLNSMELEGVEVEMLESENRVRFCAPARYEIGLAGMVAAHGGKLLPSLSVDETPVTCARTA